jgi:hypothetical protein
LGLGFKEFKIAVESEAVGVGHPPKEKPPIPAVWRSNVRRSKTRPFRIDPDLGQVTEDKIESSAGKSDRCDVLQEHEPGSYHANDPRKLSPQS